MGFQSIMKKRVAALIIAPIIGAVLGYVLVYALNNGWFSSKWQMIAKPPGEVLHLVALNRDSLWVESATGAIYYNENSTTCKSNCWQEVAEVPTLPIVEPEETAVAGKACAPSLPIGRVSDRISECRSTLWVDYDFTFALRKDGSIYLWQAVLYKEWTVVLLIMGVCVGAFALFLLALLTVLILRLRDRHSNSATTLSAQN